MNPEEKRLAIMVEDHPLIDTRSLKATLCAGTVIIWDKGTYSLADKQNTKLIGDNVKSGLQSGNLSFFSKRKEIHRRISPGKIKNQTKKRLAFDIKRGPVYQ
ncbi:DNA polymerase ligase N-terminal domain-containing protein [Flavobacterium franklandianum]|uniref:DNA polymerase ligase N-terminal domain-containing protein n=1 Tax=Flavobacterium franklandianum TaxID=2594430 RepID=UPI001F2E8272|nr:DNA polymerase ligase N-terminal domain-containing protein [Flavobacterium franklandianum]